MQNLGQGFAFTSPSLSILSIFICLARWANAWARTATFVSFSTFLFTWIGIPTRTSVSLSLSTLFSIRTCRTSTFLTSSNYYFTALFWETRTSVRIIFVSSTISALSMFWNAGTILLLIFIKEIVIMLVSILNSRRVYTVKSKLLIYNVTLELMSRG